jgi:hypothetical protein
MQNQRRLRLPPWLAWALWVVVVTLAVVSMVLLVLNRTAEQAGIQQWGVALVEQVLYLSLPTIGLLIATRRPANPLGWLFLLAGLGLSAYGFASGYATYALLREPGALPGGPFMAWLQQWIFALIFIATPFLFLLFPHRPAPVSSVAAGRLDRRCIWRADPVRRPLLPWADRGFSDGQEPHWLPCDLRSHL